MANDPAFSAKDRFNHATYGLGTIEVSAHDTTILLNEAPLVRDDVGPGGACDSQDCNLHPRGALVYARKPKPIPLDEFAPWTAAHFQTEEARDRFLRVVATLPANDVEFRPMQAESRAALVRWRPGHFLDLNDVAYAHGGRIAVILAPRGAAIPWTTYGGHRRRWAR